MTTTPHTDDELEAILRRIIGDHQYIDGDTSYMSDEGLAASKQLIQSYTAAKVREATVQATLNAITQFKVDRVNHVLATPVERWERELVTADKTLATLLAELSQPEAKP